jgi:hypothetical protein
MTADDVPASSLPPPDVPDEPVVRWDAPDSGAGAGQRGVGFWAAWTVAVLAMAVAGIGAYGTALDDPTKGGGYAAGSALGTALAPVVLALLIVGGVGAVRKRARAALGSIWLPATIVILVLPAISRMSSTS